MSKDNVKKMFAKFEKDAGFQKKYAEIMKNHQKETENSLAEMLIEFGKKSGFDFSKNDLLAAKSEVIDKLNANAELDDNDLNQVSGGEKNKKAISALFSIFSFGTLCALLSVANEIDRKGRCAREMTTSDPNCKNT